MTPVAGRLSRFLNLERRRPEGDVEPRLPSAEQRFRPSPEDPPSGGGLPSDDPAPGHPAPADPAPSHRASGAERPLVDEALERLRLERLHRLASGVELAEASDAEQPFRKCALCEMDNNRAAARCQNCAAALDTAEQRDFNARLWAQRREELAREQAELAALHGKVGSGAPHGAATPLHPLGPHGADGLLGTRAFAEALARQAAIGEEQRLSSLDDGGSAGGWTRPLGWIVLESIEPGWLRFAAKLCVLGFAVLLFSLAAEESRSGVRFSVPAVFLIALALLFLPRWRRRGLFGFWR